MLLRTEKADSAARVMMPGIAWLTRVKISASTMIQEDTDRTSNGSRWGSSRRNQVSRRRKPRPTITKAVQMPNPTGKTSRYCTGV